MRAYQLQAYSGPDGLLLAEVSEPRAAAGHVLVDIEAIGVNYPDLLMTQGLYQLRPDLPIIPGCEVAGTVAAAPDNSGYKLGERVAAFLWQGGYAERAAVPVRSLTRIPDGVDSSFAAAMIVNYHTVHFALLRRGRLGIGETAFIMGAGGGIGTAGLQVAKGLGARVFAGVADEEQARTASLSGCDEVVILNEGFSAKLKELTDGRGVDVVLDPLGDWLFGEAIRGLAPEGRILVVGFAAGGIPSLKVNRILLRNVSAIGVAFGAFLDVDAGLMDRQGVALNGMVADGIVRPQIGARYTFDQLPKALDELSRGQIPGKAVVQLSR